MPLTSYSRSILAKLGLAGQEVAPLLGLGCVPKRKDPLIIAPGIGGDPEHGRYVPPELVRECSKRVKAIAEPPAWDSSDLVLSLKWSSSEGLFVLHSKKAVTGSSITITSLLANNMLCVPKIHFLREVMYAFSNLRQQR